MFSYLSQNEILFILILILVNNNLTAHKTHHSLQMPSLERTRRAATARAERLWDYGVIPYEIEANFSGLYWNPFNSGSKVCDVLRRPQGSVQAGDEALGELHLCQICWKNCRTSQLYCLHREAVWVSIAQTYSLPQQYLLIDCIRSQNPFPINDWSHVLLFLSLWVAFPFRSGAVLSLGKEVTVLKPSLLARTVINSE